MRAGHRLIALGLGLAGVAAAGCNLTQTGEAPPPHTLNYPIAVALSGQPGEPARFMLVANSNFDLRFNAGTLQVFDLEMLRARLADCPAPCDLPLEEPQNDPLIVSEVAIGAHADGIELGPTGDRVYLPMRSERSLTYVGFDPTTGVLDCRATPRDDGPIPRCADAFRDIAASPIQSERMLALDGDPVDIESGLLSDLGGDEGDGHYVLLALREGRIALMLDRTEGQDAPILVHVAEGFPPNLVNLTMQPGTGLGWMTSAESDELARVAVTLDPMRTRSFLSDAGRLRLGGIDDGEDLRDLAFDPTDPSTAYALSRRPEAVVAVDLERRGLTSADLGVREIWEVGTGPSRLVTMEVTPEGQPPRTYVLASCFDAQKLFIIDAEYGALVHVVGGFSGPFEIAIDEASQHLYLVDFATSVIRVVDLAPLARNETPTTLATIGRPFAPSAL